MLRYNAFNLIHKALRALMYDVALTLQQTDFTNAEEAEIALARVEEVMYHFENHAHHEDNFVFAAIENAAPKLVESLEQEHVEDIELGNRLVQLVRMMKSLENNMERVNCGSAINKAFRDFMVFNIRHMSREESEINAVLWQEFTDQELIELNGKIVANISPADMAFNSRWFMRSINKTEAIMWLKAVKATAPPFVFDQLIQLAETELPERMRAEVIDAVMENELVY